MGTAFAPSLFCLGAIASRLPGAERIRLPRAVRLKGLLGASVAHGNFINRTGSHVLPIVGNGIDTENIALGHMSRIRCRLVVTQFLIFAIKFNNGCNRKNSLIGRWTIYQLPGLSLVARF